MHYIVLILVLILLVIGLVAVLSNSIQINSEGANLYNPINEAGAEATRSAADVGYQNAQLDLSIRKSLNDVEIESRRSEIEADTTARLIVATAEAGARVQAIRTQNEAQTQVTVALGQAGYVAILAIGIGLAIAAVVLAAGHSVANVKRATLTANYVQIGVDPRTLLPPPLVITRDGYLIDTRTGERARLRDAAGIDRLRLAATTHSTETAQLAQAAIEIAKATKSDQTADALVTAAGNVPMLKTSASE
ncbi:MAG: hypothetical protein JW850_23765 [Thermoflexales bacterium]|nr:hypothetical protein [Thermoflexales bacterium]